MNHLDLYPLLPLIIIGAIPVLIMLAVAVKRNHTVTFVISILGLAASFVSIFYVYNSGLPSESTLIVIDKFGLFFTGLFVLAVIAILILSYGYLEQRNYRKEEYYILMILALLGSSVLAVSKHFVALFLGLEVLSVSLYTLISYFRENEKAAEAGIKYLVLAAASSAFLLFGMALVYFEAGSMDFALIGERLQEFGVSTLFYTGLGIMVIGVGFKLAVVPFHLWTPDVYEGASSPVTAFIASVSKGGMFAVLFRFFLEINAYNFTTTLLIFTIIAVASMIAGNLLALLQQNVKRILAYSSISHLGYMLVAFIAGGNFGVEAVTFYITAYFVTIIAAFGIITVLSGPFKEADDISDYRGLFWKRPWLSVFFTLVLLSLAGIPLTAGFIGKFYVAAAGVNSSLWLLTFSLVLNSAVGIFYYLRIVTSFYSTEAEAETLTQRLSAGGISVIIALSVALIWLGVYPSGVMRLIEAMVRNFV
jgi:NADH-quinone oxidoreductase subunit N